MSFLLDTDTCIDFLRGRQPSVRDRIRARTPGSIAVSVVTAAELRHGADRSARPEETHAAVDAFLGDLEVLSLEQPAARAYGRIRTKLEREGRTIGANDLFIAAHAVAVGRTLVTSKVREFSPGPGPALGRLARVKHGARTYRAATGARRPSARPISPKMVPAWVPCSTRR